MVNAWKIILASLVIFATGVVTGGITVTLGKRLAEKREQAPQKSMAPWSSERMEQQQRDLMRRMDRHFSLSPEQRDQIRGILQESHQRIQSAWEDVAPVAQDELKRMRTRLREALTPAQRQRFDETFKSRPLSPQERLYRESARRQTEEEARKPELEGRRK